METKGNIAARLTKKNYKNVLEILEMFGENTSTGLNKPTKEHPFISFNNVFWVKIARPVDRAVVKPRQLRNILAKEHLKKGDVCVFGVGDEEEVRVLSKVDDSVYPFESKDKGYTESYSEFLRYATDEEKALLEPANALTPREIPKRTFRKIEIAEFIGIPVEQLEIID